MSDEKATRFPGYYVDSHGRVWSSHPWRGQSWRQIVPKVNQHGYLAFKAKTEPTKSVKARVHLLVCEAFHGPRPTPAHQVRHLDGNRQNNCASNLAWGTVLENAQDRERHGNGRGRENGRKSAWKLKGIRKPICPRGHDKNGRTTCLKCRSILRKKKP